MKISEIITDKYKLHIPPTVYYELLADVVEAEEEQEPCEDAVSREAVLSIIDGWYEQNRETENIEDLIILITYMDSVTPKPTEDAISIRKDALKTRVGNIVAYNVEWLKDHWQMEMDIVCGVKPCEDAISRKAVLKEFEKGTENLYGRIDKLPSVTPIRPKGHWDNHQVACLLADMFGDTCACNYNNIDEWLPELCDFKDTCCPKPVGVACWEQFLKHSKARYPSGAEMESE